MANARVELLKALVLFRLILLLLLIYWLPVAESLVRTIILAHIMISLAEDLLQSDALILTQPRQRGEWDWFGKPQTPKG